jgi:hypothetical protein
MKYNKVYWYTLSLCITLLTGCQDAEKRNIPDVSDIAVDINIQRFEQALFQTDTTNMDAALTQIKAAYPQFADLFFGQLLGAYDKNVAPQGPASYIKGFVQHQPLRKLYDTCQIVYPDLAVYEQEFEQAFQFYKHYFPQAPTPTVTSFISEYSVAAFIYGENDLAVGLDYFLGADYPYRQFDPNNPAFSDYLVRTYTPEHLVAKTLQTLVDDLVPPTKGNRLLDIMVYNGKKLYLLDLFLPYTPDSIKLEITSQQVEWLNNNEKEIWAYFIKEELLYNSEWAKIRKYVDYSPNSPGMPPQAPGRTANWLGWQMVKAYMRQFPDTSLEDMLQIADAQNLLDAAKYKPRR